MIGNKFLQDLYAYPDRDTSLNQLLEHLNSKDKQFIDSLYAPLDLELLTQHEQHYLTIISAIIDYYLQLYKMDIPGWLRNEKLCFERPYFYSKRISDFEKFKLQYRLPGPFKRRNVYISLDGIKRI